MFLSKVLPFRSGRLCLLPDRLRQSCGRPMCLPLARDSGGGAGPYRRPPSRSTTGGRRCRSGILALGATHRLAALALGLLALSLATNARLLVEGANLHLLEHSLGCELLLEHSHCALERAVDTYLHPAPPEKAGGLGATVAT